MYGLDSEEPKDFGSQPGRWTAAAQIADAAPSQARKQPRTTETKAAGYTFQPARKHIIILR